MKNFFEIRENMAMKMKLINKMKKASPAAKKALEAPSRVDKKKESVEEAKSGTGYELYHKDFSSAMQHAYKHAKDKLKIVIDPREIDRKVASGPRKPSSGKTNSYRLTDKSGKKGVQIQVANLDNKRYELNMYKESLDEISVKDVANQVMMKTKADAARKRRGRNIDQLKTDLDRLKKGLKNKMPPIRGMDKVKPLNAYTEEKDSRLKSAGVSSFNKPKRTPSHPKKSHIVVAKEGDKIKTIRFGEQGASTAGDPKKGESDKMKKKRASFKARHAKNIAKGKMSAAYWADKEKW